MRRRLARTVPCPSRSLHQGARLCLVEHDRQIRDVVPSDLGATLEAHRESNLTAKIRKLGVPLERPDRPSLRRKSNTKHDLMPLMSPEQKSEIGDEQETSLSVDRERKQPSSEQVEHKQSGSPRKRRTSKIHTAKAQASGSYVAPFTRDSKDPLGLDIYAETALCEPHLRGIPSAIWSNRPKLLDQAILNLEAWAQPDAEEALTRRALTSSITALLENRFPELVFDLFGSSRTGLMIPSSDIDISFNLCAEDGSPRKIGAIKARQVIQRMRKIFYPRKDVLISHAVLNGRAPLISLVHKQTGLKIQVVATSNGQSVLPYIQAYLDEFPQLRPLFILVKLSLQSRELHEPARGGVGAYTLFMMLVAYFKGLAATRNDTVSGNLIRFFAFYDKFDTSKACIAVDPPAIFPKRWPSGKPTIQQSKVMQNNEVLRWQSKLGTISDGARPYLLCLQDPTDPSNNLGQASFRIMDVRSTFRELGKGLRQWLLGDLRGSDSEESLAKEAHVQPEEPQRDPLKPLLGDILETMQMKRRHIRRGRSRVGNRGFFHFEGVQTPFSESRKPKKKALKQQASRQEKEEGKTAKLEVDIVEAKKRRSRRPKRNHDGADNVNAEDVEDNQAPAPQPASTLDS